MARSPARTTALGASTGAVDIGPARRSGTPTSRCCRFLEGARPGPETRAARLHRGRRRRHGPAAAVEVAEVVAVEVVDAPSRGSLSVASCASFPHELDSGVLVNTVASVSSVVSAERAARIRLASRSSPATSERARASARARPTSARIEVGASAARGSPWWPASSGARAKSGTLDAGLCPTLCPAAHCSGST
jgi:hypothetical protein